MAGAIIAIAVAIFIAGIAVGVIVIVSMGIRKEEQDFLRTGRVSLTGQAPGRVSHGARRLQGVYTNQRAGQDPAAVSWQDTLV